ncbi:hypothetical protein B0T14DRAFT_427502, partial [Immersiella caudata]
KTYNTRDSLVVTDPTTSLALTGLSMGERTGSRAFQWVWSYVLVELRNGRYHGWQFEVLVTSESGKERAQLRGRFHETVSSAAGPTIEGLISHFVRHTQLLEGATGKTGKQQVQVKFVSWRRKSGGGMPAWSFNTAPAADEPGAPDELLLLAEKHSVLRV